IAAAAAGTLDIHARAAAPLLGERMGQPMVIENNGGAAGRVASAAVGRAAPDGHTILVSSGDGIVISDILYGRAQGLLRPRLRPVTMTIVAAQLLVTHPNSGIRTVEDYVARARQGQGVTLGVPGHGGIAHLISEMLNRQVGNMRVVHVPYRGGGPATLDLLAGQIDAMIITLPAVTDHVRGGRLRPLAVSTLARDPAMPGVPTLAESVAPGFDVPSTQGVLVPAGTPDAVVEAWYAAWRAALRDAAVARRLTDLGFVLATTTPPEFEASITALEARFAEVIAAAGIRAEDA
ncbi:MAG: tripartite tricarboxylate transporter substrate binding protein, partial [Acetobacteraceae bacterium]|nr:tripartite tricarboxylate transporter substrate binding protein [Acetobacteraceae bacterium]